MLVYIAHLILEGTRRDHKWGHTLVGSKRLDLTTLPLPIYAQHWAHTVIEKARTQPPLPTVSSLYINFNASRIEFPVDPRYNGIKLLDRPYIKHRKDTDFEQRNWTGFWTDADHNAFLNYTHALMMSRHGGDRPDQDWKFSDFCTMLATQHWYRHYSMWRVRRLAVLEDGGIIPAIADIIDNYMIASSESLANAKVTALFARGEQEEIFGIFDHGDRLHTYARYIFRDRLVRDSLSAEITDDSPLLKIRTTKMRGRGASEWGDNYRYYIPTAVFGNAHPSRSVPAPGIHWSERMHALRSTAPPGGRPELPMYSLGIFVESEACRCNIVEALFLAYEFAWAPLNRRRHNWASFVRYYDTCWDAEIMVREHEYFNRVHLSTPQIPIPDEG